MLIEKFMMRLQPEYPNKISVTYQSPDAIPMGMDSGSPIAMKMADVLPETISMMSQEQHD